MSIDYPAVLADLRARRNQLDAAISAIESLLPLPVQSAASSSADGSSPLMSDRSSGTLLDGTIKALNDAGRPLTIPEIAAALQRQGNTTNTPNLHRTLFTILKRESERPTARIIKQGKLISLPLPTRTTPLPGEEWRRAEPEVTAARSTPFAPKGTLGMSEAIRTVLASEPGKIFHREELLERAKTLGVVTTATDPLGTVDRAVSDLRRKGMRIDGPQPRSYRLAPTGGTQAS